LVRGWLCGVGPCLRRAIFWPVGARAPWAVCFAGPEAVDFWRRAGMGGVTGQRELPQINVASGMKVARLGVGVPVVPGSWCSALSG